MADLKRGERGQIILVAAFALAIIFVAMALIVNSAIFTENLASRGETTGSNGALSMRAMVETNVGDAVMAANRNNSDPTTAPTSNVSNSIGVISAQTGRQSARSGRVVDIANPAYTTGTRINQSDGTDFTNGAGATNYDFASGITRATDGNGTRAFVIDASGSLAGDNSSAFEIQAQKSSAPGNANSWRARIWRVSTDTVHVRTFKNDSSSELVEDCEVTHDASAPSVRIDVTGGTIAGEECDALGTTPSGENFHFEAGTELGPADSYDITFSNADNITGNLSVVVHPVGLSPASGFDSQRAVYDVTVELTYLTSDLRYESDVRVAPGEPDV